MGRNIAEIIAALPKQRRDRVNRKARQMAGEMIAYADSLGAVRRAVSMTQSQIGAHLGLPQNAISQLEKRSDLLVSTLARYVDALGAELDLIVRMKDGTEIIVETLGKTRKSVKTGRKVKNAQRSYRKAA